MELDNDFIERFTKLENLVIANTKDLAGLKDKVKKLTNPVEKPVENVVPKQPEKPPEPPKPSPPPVQPPKPEPPKPIEPPKPKPPVPPVKPTEKLEGDLENLRNLLIADKWPAAVEPNLICDSNSEQDKQDRAEGILDIIIDTDLKGLKFLDFGCGEGHVVNKTIAYKKAENPEEPDIYVGPDIAVGYDILPLETYKRWKPNPKAVYTNDWAAVEQNGPYNIVLMYDVIDHMSGSDEDVIRELEKIHKVMAPGGKIFVRCHPWCSRHATHLYQQINKAYIHLVFTPEELQKMGYATGQWARKIIHPMMTYEKMFKSAGLKYNRSEQVVRSDVERFFADEHLVAERIKGQYKESHDKDLRDGKKFPWQQMEFQFIDYILSDR